MFTFTEHVDVMTTNEDAFYAVADLMMRGHFYPESVFLLKETAPRPPSPTEKFLPGQSASYRIGDTTYETEITAVEEWHNAEAHISEALKNSPRGERLDWRLSELLRGTIRVELKFSADYGLLEKLSRGNQVRKFWRTTLDRLKQYLEDKQSLAHPRMFAPKPQDR